MRARTFFAVLKAAKKKEYERQSLFYYELTNIVCAPVADAKWRSDLQTRYKLGFDPDSKPKMLDNEIAGQVLTAMLGGGN